MTAEQRPVVDDLGNIAVHGRSGLVLVVKIETATAGVYENISASDLFFEIGGKLRLALSAGADIYSRQVILTRAQIATLSINQPYAFAIHDETPSTPSTPWTGTITTFGFKVAPTGVPDVDGEAANWTGATVVIQPGGGSPVVVVNYMGQPGVAGAAGVGIPTGGTTGQYLRKSSSTDYATGWDTLTADDVSGLSSTLSTLTSADVSLTTRLSTEETTRATADTSLTTRLSTEEVTRSSAVSTVTVATTSLTTRVSTEEATRSSADTSLATAAAATYLPLAGGTLTGALAAVAGTAALPGLAVAGDLDTGIYGVSANVLGVSAGGGVVQSWGVGTSTLTGHLLAGADATYDLGASGANRFRDAWFSRTVTAGTSFVAPDGTNTAPGFTFGTSQTGIYRDTGGERMRFAHNGGFAADLSMTGFVVRSDTGQIGIGATGDASLFREGPGILAFRNAANAQAFRVYNTTDGTNLERVSLDWSANIAYLRTQKGGTGADRSIVISATASTYIGGGGTFQWQFSSDGNFYPNANATTDAGGAAKQIRDLYLSRRLMIGGAAPAGASGLAAVQGFGTDWSLIGANTLTDATSKNNIIGTLHYLSAQPPVISIYTLSSGSTNTLNFGGGSATGNAATLLNFYTAAGLTTPTGTIRWSMDTSGHFLAGADNTYDIGASGANRPRIAYIGTRVVAPTVTTTATTVASLPAAATAGAGGRAFVTDATATTYLSIVAGGGANAVPVVSNGTNWLIG